MTKRASPQGSSNIDPAEPEERAALAQRELLERAEELKSAGPVPGAEGEAPVDAAPRDVGADKAALAAVAEVLAQGAARLVALRWPQTALMARTVCQKAQSFGAEVGDKFGALAGQALPRALPAVGGIAGIFAWWLRSLELPEPPPLPKPQTPNTPQSGYDGSTAAGSL